MMSIAGRVVLALRRALSRSSARGVVAAGAAVVGVCMWTPGAFASFHLMQIEQVIGGVNGNTAAQAIQLRMRTTFQNLVSNGRVRAWDAAGLNPVLIIDMTTDVANSLTGDRVLLCTPAFAASTTPACVPNFLMTNPIPASYLAAGRLTFEDDFGTIYWSLAWGGASYTGSNTGSITNDADGNFGPAFAGPCPKTTLQALKFTGAATVLSTNNAANYALTSGAAVFTNNARTNFTVVSTCTGPAITQQPDPPDMPHVGDVVNFSVTATGSATLNYVWRKDTVPLTDDARIMGSHTAALTITTAEVGDIGEYDVVVSNGCGSATSDPASLAVFCFSDFDHNGFVNGDDFDAFVFFFEAGDIQADVDGNTFVNGDDFDQFTEHFVAGC